MMLFLRIVSFKSLDNGRWRILDGLELVPQLELKVLAGHVANLNIFMF